MFSKIAQWIQALMRRLLDGRTRSTGNDTSLDSSSQVVINAQDGLFDQAALNDDEPDESASTTESDQSGRGIAKREPATPSSDGLEEPPSDPPQDVLPELDSPSAQPVEDRRVPGSKTDIGVSSSPDSTASHPESQEKAEPPEDNAPNENSGSLEGKRKPQPKDIGGRRKGTVQAQSSGNDGAKDKPTFTPRPELICRKSPRSWQWEVVLYADDECNIVEVRRGGDPLVARNGEYHLSSLVGELSIHYADRESDQLALFDGTPMIFKLRNKWDGDGRKVRDITRGHFIVIAPREWKRTGSAPVEQEKCVDADFMAHYFYVSKGEPAKDRGGFEGYELPSTNPGFQLTGELVFDDSEDGELFVGAVPKLTPSAGVVWARVGEEAEDGWRGENFRPSERSLEDILNGRQGRFFIRVYNAKVEMLHSDEFRYVRNLKEIHVNGKPYTEQTVLVPAITGHPPTKVRLIGVDGTTIHPILPPELTHVEAREDGLVVKSHPSGDKVSCALGVNYDRVEIVVNLPRIWWRIKRGDGELGEWRDMPFVATRQEFREYATANSTILLRLPWRVNTVFVGFDADLNRRYPSCKEEDISVSLIPLNHFVDYSQIDQRLNEDTSFNIRCNDSVIPLIRISADPTPEIISFTCEPAAIIEGEKVTLRWATRNTEAGGVRVDPEIGAVVSSGSLEVTLSETTTYTLRLTAFGMNDVTKVISIPVASPTQPNANLAACVCRTGRGMRQGKGFSLGELRAVDLTVADAKCQSLPVDKRRRSTHEANVVMLRRLMNV